MPAATSLDPQRPALHPLTPPARLPCPAGTNFCIRAKALAACGWFPEYTITEDYALSMELKKRGFTGKWVAGVKSLRAALPAPPVWCGGCLVWWLPGAVVPVLPAAGSGRTVPSGRAYRRRRLHFVLQDLTLQVP